MKLINAAEKVINPAQKPLASSRHITSLKKSTTRADSRFKPPGQNRDSLEYF